jgi:hypothetical protein
MTEYWQHTDLTAKAGGVAAMWAYPVGYVTTVQNLTSPSPPVARVLYVTDWGNGGDIHEIRNEGGTWKPDADLSLLLTNYSGDFQAQIAAVGYQTPDGVARVVFLGLDNWVYEFKLEANGWTVANLSAIAGMTQFPQPGWPTWPPQLPWQEVTPLGIPPWPYYTTPDNHARVVYQASDGHVHELSLHVTDPNSAWIDSDLNALAIAGGWDAPNTYNQPFGYLSGDSIPRVVYNDADSYGVRELRLESSGWICANIGALANAPPGMPIDGGVINSSAYVTPDAIARVVYLGDDGHAHELKLVNDQSPWVHTDLTGQLVTTPNGMLYGCCGSDGIPRVVYGGSDNDLHQFTYQNGSWADENMFQDPAIVVVDPPPGGIAATGWDWLSAYIYQINGIVQIVYTGADQHIHLLSQIPPDEGQRRHKVFSRAVNLRKALARTRS